MIQIYDFEQLNLLADFCLFLDANILIFRFWEKYTDNPRACDYGVLYDQLVQQKKPMSINFNVLSEIINRVSKEEWHVWREWQLFRGYKHHLEYKDFRDSTEGKRAIDKIHTTIKTSILPYVTIDEAVFDVNSIEKLLVTDGLDFNDKAIVTLCKEKNFAVVTDDFDFYDRSISVLTCNPRFFGKRKVF